MRRAAKRDLVGGSTEAGDTQNLRDVKRERLSKDSADGADELRAVKRGLVEHSSRGGGTDAAEREAVHACQQNPSDRRKIRSDYLKLMNLIDEKRDDLVLSNSEKFDSIMSEVEKLHEQVQNPREQVADAAALLDLANTLVGSVKSLMNEGISPSEFVSCLINKFGQGQSSQEGARSLINWTEVGSTVSPIFMKIPGCHTMLGPMENELKQRKTTIHRKRARPTARARPEELDNVEEEKTDTDKNMATIFEILKKMKRVRLERILLNRTSFAQTVENLFALSFLVKDGRVAITMDESGSHFVSPRNAPAANAVMSNEVSYSHFVFRFDYQDWKLMKDAVPDGEELMPHRQQYCTLVDTQADTGVPPVTVASPSPSESPPVLVATPIRKLSRNRGRIVQEEGVVEESPEADEENGSRVAAIRRCRLKLN